MKDPKKIHCLNFCINIWDPGWSLDMYILGQDSVRIVKHLYLLKYLKTVGCPHIECLHMRMRSSMIPQCMDTVCAGHIRVSHIPVFSSCLSVEPMDSSVLPQFVRGHRTPLPLRCGILGFKAFNCILILLLCPVDCWDRILHKKQHKEGRLVTLHAHLGSRVNRERVGLK